MTVRLDNSRWWGILAAFATGFVTILAGAALRSYGPVVFVFAPLVMGFVAAYVDSVEEHRSMGNCMASALLPLLLVAIVVVAVKIEGVICLVMAAPLAVPEAIFGAIIAFRLQRHRGARVLNAAMIILLPIGLILSPHGPGTETATATTSMIVNAPPTLVWKYVTAFPDLAPPDDFLFRAGVAYPIATHVFGQGIGASRECVLSTGTMTERVTAWEPGHLLRFDVLYTPPSMKELSPWADIHPPHLDGFYTSKQGEFRLTELSGGRTLVEGQSWYRNGLTPFKYWNLWSAHIVHRVHVRVLSHIKHLAETDSRAVQLATARPAQCRR